MKRAWYLHPILFAAYPALGEVAFNVTQNPPLFGARIVLLSVLVGGVLLLLAWLSTRDGHRAAFLASLLVFPILGYGHVYRLVQGKHIGPFVWGRPEIILGVWALLIILLGSRWTWRRLHDSQLITQFMNVAAIAAVALPALKVGWTLASTAVDNAKLEGKHVALEADAVHLQGAARPDIYYIVLDGYGREDVLREVYGLDNSEFTNFLVSRGFVVAAQAQTNYMQTALSLATSLNMSYMDTLGSALGPRSQDREPLVELIRKSLVRESLAQQGYEMVALSSGIYFTEIPDADVYLSPTRTSLNELEGLWLSTTAMALVKDPESLGLSIPSYQNTRRLIEYAFQQLMEVGSRPGPQFVFAHIVAPHPPFVFDASGKPVDPPWPYQTGDGERCCGTVQEYQVGYSQELEFVNGRMEEVIDAIQAKADTPPVILIQGDHGPGALLNLRYLDRTCLRERIPILSAYYLPATGKDKVYPAITPVNSFRIVFNSLFNTGLDLLPDASYFSTWYRPYDFVDVGNRVQQSCNFQGSTGVTPSP
jgi:Sulfatase